MMRPVLMSALLTGCFCGVFAVGIDWVTDMLGRGSILLISFTSGFLGSLFASFVLRRRGGQE